MDALPTHRYQYLKRMDLLLHREILRLRTRYQLSLDEFRGLYVSDQQVDALVAQTSIAGGVPSDVDTLTAEASAIKQTVVLPPAWTHMKRDFDLTEFEMDVLLLALAPEVDIKYETLLAYLNNDVTRKYPTVDLALRVFDQDRTSLCRASLLPYGRLFEYGLIDPVKTNGHATSVSLAQGFHLPLPVTNYLLDLPVKDDVLADSIEYPDPNSFDRCDSTLSSNVEQKLQRLVALQRDGIGPGLVVLEGLPGAGRAHFAFRASRQEKRQLLIADQRVFSGTPDEINLKIKRLGLLGRILNARVYVNLDDIAFGEKSAALQTLRTQLTRRHRAGSIPADTLYIGVTEGAPWQQLCRGLQTFHVVLDDPNGVERQTLWAMQLKRESITTPVNNIREIANLFILNPGQIQSATRQAKLLNESHLDLEALCALARDQSTAELGKLAQKVELKYSWSDLVLPATTQARVKEIAQSVSHRNRVYQEWGMERRVHNANSLIVLFSGASGTGKTMTASVIAREIGLYLYRIDLAGVVSKYIGETEKNLDRIFSAARRANAILFLDEADALMGKRSEVKDAHDRYANIEVSYLLQKIEQHDGVVILATNIPKNIDQAFSRRMHHVVEFPRPDAKYREQLWRGIFPSQVPLDDKIDFNFLARQFNTTGGDIKNIALDAAFLAAQNGQIVDMEQLIKAMARQMIKQGKAPSATDFKQYHTFIQ